MAEIAQRAPKSLSWACAALLAMLAAGCAGRESPSAALEPAYATLLAAPHVTLAVVTDWQATLKPCGCTPESQTGGVERIGRWLSELRATDNSVVLVHAGNLLHDAEGLDLPGKAEQLALRRAAFVQVVDKLGLAAAAVAEWDLAHGGPAALQAYQRVKSAKLAQNPALASAEAAPGKLIGTASGGKIGVLALDLPAEDVNRHALAATEVARLRAAGAQAVVALENRGMRAARRLARAVTGIDAIVVGGLDERVEPLTDAEREGETLLVHAARHGAAAVALTLLPRTGQPGPWVDAEVYLPNAASELQQRRASAARELASAVAKPTLAARLAVPYLHAKLADIDRRAAAAKTAAGKALPAGNLMAFRAANLPWSTPTDPAISALVAAYDRSVAEVAAAGAPPALPAPGEAGYVGQATCLECHSEAAAFAKTNAHGHAWQTLQAANKTRDLDCVPCHVTGFGQPGGSTLGQLGNLTAVQCESCHGPGSLHAADPAAGPKSHLRAVTEATCTACHTPQHAPRFAFAPFRQMLLVPGHGAAAAP